jgi:hypothetical protein
MVTKHGIINAAAADHFKDEHGGNKGWIGATYPIAGKGELPI